MKTIIVITVSIILFVAMPWGTQESNNNCVLHPVQVAIWEAFGSHPDAFYVWRDR